MGPAPAPAQLAGWTTRPRRARPARAWPPQQPPAPPRARAPAARQSPLSVLPAQARHALCWQKKKKKKKNRQQLPASRPQTSPPLLEWFRGRTFLGPSPEIAHACCAKRLRLSQPDTDRLGALPPAQHEAAVVRASDLDVLSAVPGPRTSWHPLSPQHTELRAAACARLTADAAPHSAGAPAPSRAHAWPAPAPQAPRPRVPLPAAFGCAKHSSKSTIWQAAYTGLASAATVCRASSPHAPAT